MKVNKWFSERLNQWIDLEKLSKEELILEIFSERKSFLDLEQELDEHK